LTKENALEDYNPVQCRVEDHDEIHSELDKTVLFLATVEKSNIDWEAMAKKLPTSRSVADRNKRRELFK